MSLAGSRPGRRFFRPGFPSRAGPKRGTIGSFALKSIASSRIRTQTRSTIAGNRSGSFPFLSRASQIARRICSGSRLILRARSSPSSVSTAIGFRMMRESRRAWTTSGTGNAIPSGHAQKPGQPLEHRRALLVEPEDRLHGVAEHVDPHRPAPDRKARLVGILARACLARWKPTSMTARRQLLATRSTMALPLSESRTCP